MKVVLLCRFCLVILVILLIALLVSLTGGLILAQTGGYELFWWTADGGGGISGQGAYTLKGTAGQPDADQLQGGNYSLQGGFWKKEVLPRNHSYRLYLPICQKP